MASESSSTECTACGHTHKRNTHTCGWKFTDTYSCECKGPQAVPMVTPCRCGHTRNFHLDGRRMFPCIAHGCECGNFKVKQEAKPDLRCTCGCLRSQHMGKPRGCQNHAFHAFRCDHSQCGWKPREDAHDFVDGKHCDACAKAWDDQLKGVRMIPRPGSAACEHAYKYVTGGVFKCGCGAVALLAEPGTEPPLTSEEEEKIAAEFRDADAEHLPPPEGPACTCGETACESESCDCDSAPCPVDHAGEAPEDANKAICGSCYTDHSKGSCEPAEAPPQPERRPPYAVDYSAGGHAFQVLVPGDAAVLAVDGALIIRHADFPVLGISCITPLRTEAS